MGEVGMHTAKGVLPLYNRLVTVAKDHSVPVALCKEPVEVWRQLGLKGKCNCMG